MKKAGVPTYWPAKGQLEPVSIPKILGAMTFTPHGVVGGFAAKLELGATTRNGVGTGRPAAAAFAVFALSAALRADGDPRSISTNLQFRARQRH